MATRCMAEPLPGVTASRHAALPATAITTFWPLRTGTPKSPRRVPYVCGESCHTEGTPVQKNLKIDQHNILENYTESIHGEGLLKKGLVVAANCAPATPHITSCRIPTRTPPLGGKTSPPPAPSVTRRLKRCTARRFAASFGKRKPTISPPAPTATSHTDSECAL